MSPLENRQSVSHKDFNLSVILAESRDNGMWGQVQKWVHSVLGVHRYHLLKRNGVYSEFCVHHLGDQSKTLFDSHLCVAHALWLRHLVGEVRLLKARGTHALVHGGVRARWRIRRVEACLDQGFARFARDHGLEFAGGKSVDVACFTGHKQQNLGSRQGGEFICLGERKKTVEVRNREDGPRARLDFKHQKDMALQIRVWITFISWTKLSLLERDYIVHLWKRNH